MTWAAIRDGMKTRLATISGLVPYDVFPDKSPDGDIAMVLPGQPLIEPSAHGGFYDVRMRVLARCQRATASDAQAALDPYLWPSGASSIIAAVYGDPTLGGVVDGCQFETVENYNAVENSPHEWQADIYFKAKVDA